MALNSKMKAKRSLAAPWPTTPGKKTHHTRRDHPPLLLLLCTGKWCVVRCIKISNIVKITGNKNRNVNATCKCRRRPKCDNKANARADSDPETQTQSRTAGGEDGAGRGRRGCGVGQLFRRLKLAVKLWQTATEKDEENCNRRKQQRGRQRGGVKRGRQAAGGEGEWKNNDWCWASWRRQLKFKLLITWQHSGDGFVK